MSPTCHAPRRPVVHDEHPSGDAFFSNSTDISAQNKIYHSDNSTFNLDHVITDGSPEALLPHIAIALDKLLYQVGTNLKFTKAIYRGTKRSLTGPGFEMTRLNTNDTIFGTNSDDFVQTFSSVSERLSSERIAKATICDSTKTPEYLSETETVSPSPMPPCTSNTAMSEISRSKSTLSEKSRSNLSGRFLRHPPNRSDSHTSQASQKSEKPESAFTRALQLSRSLSCIPEKQESILNSNASSMYRNSPHRPSVASMKSMTDIITEHHDYRQQTSVKIWRFMEDRRSSLAALVYFHLRNFTLACSCVAAFFETSEDSIGNVSPARDTVVAMCIQMGFEALFACELMLRFCACRNRADFFYNQHNLIDLVSVCPIALRICILAGYDDSIEMLSILGIALVLRALKFLRHFDTFHLLMAAFVTAAEALPILLFTLSLIAGAFAALMYYFEPRSNIPTFPLSVYFTIVTVSTVGYGDFAATTIPGRMCACVLAIIGPMYMAIPIGIIGGSFSAIWHDRHRLSILQRMRQCVANTGYSPAELKRMFELLDTNGDGTLDMQEFTYWLELLGLTESEEFIQQVFESFDADDEGTINFEELLRGLFPRVHRRVQQSAYQSDHKVETPTH